MANLSTVTSDDCQTVATLTQATKTLTEQFESKDIWATSQKAELKRFLDAQGNAISIASAEPTNTHVRKTYKTKKLQLLLVT
jgi:hypothetical protein